MVLVGRLLQHLYRRRGRRPVGFLKLLDYMYAYMLPNEGGLPFSLYNITRRKFYAL